jgi:hypothetical protein
MFTLKVPKAGNAFRHPTLWVEKARRGLSVRLPASEAQVLVDWLNMVMQPKEPAVGQEPGDDELSVAFYDHIYACLVCRTGVYCEAGRQMWREWSESGGSER